MGHKFKILRVSHIFTPNQMVNVLANVPNFYDISFCEQMAILSNLKVDNCSALSKELGKIGYCVYDVYYDLEVPQKKWAEENDVHWQSSDWENQILLNQIEKIKPDILFFQKTPRLPKAVLFGLKKRFKFLKKIVYHTAYLGASGDLNYVDFLLVGTPSLVERFRQKGYKPHLFYHYFDSSILDSLIKFNESESFKFTFLGSSGFGGGFLHTNRYELLYYLAQKTDITMWLNEPNINYIKIGKIEKYRHLIKRFVKSVPVSFLSFIKKTFKKSNVLEALINECIREIKFDRKACSIPNKPLKSLFPEKCNDGLMGLEYYKVMYNSKISLTKSCNNIYDGDEGSGGDIGSIRLFEVTGLGSCLLTDTGPNMKDLFEEDSEIVTYKTKEEALDKLDFLINNEKMRQTIAKAGQLRTLKDHTEKNRAKYFDFLLQQEMLYK